MAVTVGRGLQATDDELSNDYVVSMQEQVAMLDKDDSQFTTMLMKLDPQVAKALKEEWMTDQRLPKITALSASAASAAAGGSDFLAVTTSEGNYAKVGDIGLVVPTGEHFRVTTVQASGWSVVRGIGSAGAGTAASGSGAGGILIVNGSNEQGGTLPTAVVTVKVACYFESARLN